MATDWLRQAGAGAGLTTVSPGIATAKVPLAPAVRYKVGSIPISGAWGSWSRRALAVIATVQDFGRQEVRP